MAGNSQHSDNFYHKSGDAFIKKLEQEVERNLNNEQFGVEELAESMSMSRSNLHRKLQQNTGQSVSQFIREYRLRRGLDYLENEGLTVSETAFKVGFSSPSYFTSCFTDYFGYLPSGVKNKLSKNHVAIHVKNKNERSDKFIRKGIIAGLLVMTGLVAAYFIFQPLSDKNVSYSKQPGENSIAVLPFKNLSEDKENEYFIEGVAGAITTNLSGIADLNVISSTSSGKYKNSVLSAKEIGEELLASHLLEGSIQRHLNEVRVDVRLIDAGTERQLWAESYDQELEDIFDIQREIAQKVAFALESRLSEKEKNKLNRAITQNTKAYDLYLKGIYLNRTYSVSGNVESSKCFKEAISLDSGFALAYSGLALNWVAKAAIFDASMSPQLAFEKAMPLLEKAGRLEPELAEVNFLKGFISLFGNWDFEDAEWQYKKAIVDNHPEALAVYADFLNFTKRHEEAYDIAQRLNRAHPHYPNSRLILALYYLDRYDEAEEFAEDRLKTFSNYFTLDNIGFLYLNTGRYHEAIHYFQRAIDLEGIRYPRMLGWMGAAYAKSGQEDKARALLQELKEKKNEGHSGSYAFFVAVIYAALDDASSALEWLEISYKNHDMEIPWLLTEPQFHPLHDEPIFQELVQKVGFPNSDFSS